VYHSPGARGTEDTCCFSTATTSCARTRNFAPSSRLYHAREKTPLKKLLITSALPKEGNPSPPQTWPSLVGSMVRRVLLDRWRSTRSALHMMLARLRLPAWPIICREDATNFRSCSGSHGKLFFIPSGQEISDPAELVANAG